jgi:polar amino acid transport system permease protein
LNVPEMMLVLFVSYVLVVTMLAGALHALERNLVLPGYGQ